VDLSNTRQYPDLLLTHPSWYRRAWHWFASLWSEDNFAKTDARHRNAREQSIQLEQLALNSATRLNSTGFRGLNLSSEEIVTVVVHTVRILMLTNELREALHAEGLSPRDEHPGPSTGLTA
jgi:hypothetical protein